MNERPSVPGPASSSRLAVGHISLPAPLLEAFSALLKARIGFDIDSIGVPAFERAVARRIAARFGATPPIIHSTSNSADDPSNHPAHYWQVVQHDPAEWQALIEELVVPETWFFREARAFAALVQRVTVLLARIESGLADARVPGPVRILSAPCSTGEEPYSIAMALHDAGIAPDSYRVDAVDISERALALACAGNYGRNSFRGADLGFRERYFSESAQGWQIAPLLQRQVRFARANLFELSPAPEGRYDFVFCRNVLIYFDRVNQRRAVGALSALLGDDGVLFVGPAETGLLMLHGFKGLGIPLAFAFERRAGAPARVIGPQLAAGAADLPLWARAATASTPANTVSAAEQGASRVPAAPRMTPDAAKPGAAHGPRGHAVPAVAPAVSKVASSATANATASATSSATANATSSAAPNATSPSTASSDVAAELLRAAQAAADAGQLAQARAQVDLYLAGHGPSADAYYLLGLLADADDRRDEALESYRKAVYLHPTHQAALSQLASLMALAGDHLAAQRFMARAERATPAAPGSDTVSRHAAGHPAGNPGARRKGA